jgi:hypothetical protein
VRQPRKEVLDRLGGEESGGLGDERPADLLRVGRRLRQLVTLEQPLLGGEPTDDEDVLLGPVAGVDDAVVVVEELEVAVGSAVQLSLRSEPLLLAATGQWSLPPTRPLIAAPTRQARW